MAHSICNDLDCKKGVLRTTRHNGLRDGVSELLGKAFNPSHVCDYPLIHPGRVVREGKTQPAGSPQNNSSVATENSDQKGDLLIRNLWKRGADIIHKMRVVNNETLYHHNKSREEAKLPGSLNTEAATILPIFPLC